MHKLGLSLLIGIFLFACDSAVSATSLVKPTMNLIQAQRLADLPLGCINTEYPNKLNDVIGSDKDLTSPREKHPAFYGCFDWHLLKSYPDLDNSAEIKTKLLANISQENMQREIEFFQDKHNKSWERTYGWAWYLVLYAEVQT